MRVVYVCFAVFTYGIYNFIGFCLALKVYTASDDPDYLPIFKQMSAAFCLGVFCQLIGTSSLCALSCLVCCTLTSSVGVYLMCVQAISVCEFWTTSTLTTCACVWSALAL